eukprot:225566-Pelagomonas_calceolata.AAC.3
MQGSFTVLVSEPYAATGVDVCAPTQLRRRPGVPLLQGIVPFKSQFAPEEQGRAAPSLLASENTPISAFERAKPRWLDWWSLIQSFAHDEALAGAAFQRLWSLKESYIKARGDGLGFEPLSRARFVFEGEDAWSARASVVVDGKPCPRWGFSLHELPHGHWVAVAKGDPQDIVDAQKGCALRTEGSQCARFHSWFFTRVPGKALMWATRIYLSAYAHQNSLVSLPLQAHETVALASEALLFPVL